MAAAAAVGVSGPVVIRTACLSVLDGAGKRRAELDNVKICLS
jgi:hypothetical protein